MNVPIFSIDIRLLTMIVFLKNVLFTTKKLEHFFCCCCCCSNRFRIEFHNIKIENLPPGMPDNRQQAVSNELTCIRL
jgi:hypothetical protein